MFTEIGSLNEFVIYEDEAYVEFKNSDDASNAISKLNDKKYLNKRILVEWALIDQRGGRRNGGIGGDRPDYRDRDRLIDVKCYNCN